MAATREKLEKALGRSEVMADVLEGKMLKRIPVIKHIPLIRSIPIPVDAIVGLFPVAGDVVAGSAALYIVAEAHIAGVPWSEIKRMLTSIAIDTGFGAIPLAGDAFDWFYKSNNKNIEIFREYVAQFIAEHETLKSVLTHKQDVRRFEDRRHVRNIEDE